MEPDGIQAVYTGMLTHTHVHSHAHTCCHTYVHTCVHPHTHIPTVFTPQSIPPTAALCTRSPSWSPSSPCLLQAVWVWLGSQPPSPRAGVSRCDSSCDETASQPVPSCPQVRTCYSQRLIAPTGQGWAAWDLASFQAAKRHIPLEGRRRHSTSKHLRLGEALLPKLISTLSKLVLEMPRE